MKAGRQFEELIEIIKQVRLPDASIKSPERVRDVDTGTSREVDVGIRIRTDNGEIFIAVECRDREGIEDITWVEQLITKKRSIQADLIIAVTSSDFTQPARKKAAIHGVQLRRVREFQPEELLEWSKATYVTISYICLEGISDVQLYCDDNQIITVQLQDYRYSLDQAEGLITFEDFLGYVWSDDILYRLRDKLTNYADAITFQVKLVLQEKAYIERLSRQRIQSVIIKGTAKHYIDRYPATKMLVYENRIETELLAEAYRYAISGSEAVRLLVDSETKKASLEIDWIALKTKNECMRDVISAITLICREPIILTRYRLRLGARDLEPK